MIKRAATDSFVPSRGLANPHVQTILPRFLYNGRRIEVVTQELTLPDNDFVDLAWRNPPAKHTTKPIIVIFHGLEGSVQSPYAQGLLQAIGQRGWHGVVMHYRGCSGRPNHLARSYHSGETGDARYFLDWLRQQYPEAPLAAVGYSLGGNMLLKLQAEYADRSPLRVAVSVSAPLLLDRCSDRIRQGVSRVYQRHLLDSLKRKVLSKFEQHDYERLIGLSPARLQQADSFWDFDDIYTAPVHGFNDAHDYYQQASARRYLQGITRPTLIIHALDDPFMAEDILPGSDQIPPNIQLQVSRHGGHVGFIAGSPWRPGFWLQQRIPAYLAEFVI